MLFNSYLFILYFLPVCILGYFALNRLRKERMALLFLLGMSLWFYGYFNISYLLIIISSILVNYGFYVCFKRPVKRFRKPVFAAALLFNIGLLFYFKYYDFFAENLNMVLKTDFVLKNLVLPLGISFFTFQQLSFIIDAYRGEIKTDYRFLEYALFVSFFPQLTAGPIVTHDELVPQFSENDRKQFRWDNFAKGFYLFVLGLGKKVLIADKFGTAADWGFGNIGTLDSMSAVIVMLSYTIQIYFDFSAYSDMAIGIGKMLNIDLPVNFNSPYKAVTILDFWDRWHMTLTRFLTKYVYIPLGGNRKGKGRTYLNIMLVFLISGLWHGANWTFILWGALHGIFSVITRWQKRIFDRLPKMINWFITFVFVNFTWVIFRADSIRDAGYFIGRILRCDFRPVYRADMYVLFLIAFYFLFGSENACKKMQSFRPTIMRAVMISILFVCCVMSLSDVSTFLYFNF